MLSYILKRLLLIIPTLFGIMLINFIIVQAAPGGPVEQMIAKITNTGVDASAKFSGGGFEISAANKNAGSNNSQYLGSRGLDPDLIKEIEQYYGFDKPAYLRFLQMIKNYAVFDFGESFFKDKSVAQLVIDKMPVSISLGLWTTLLVYLISIPLGIKKAIKNNSKFDIWTSVLISVAYAIPGFLFAIILIVLFSGGNYWQIFPLRGLTSPNFDQLSFIGKIADYFWHITLPVLSMVISGFAGLTILTKNSFLEEIGKQYVQTARAKGVSENKILYGHVFRNAMLIVVAGFPSAFVGILFTGSLLIETIFSLDGLGLLGFESVVNRDYPVVFGTLFFFTLVGLILNLIGDLVYILIDPRIDFEKRSL